MDAGKRKSLRKRMRDLERTLAKTSDDSAVESKKRKLEDLKLVKKLVLKNTNLYEKYKTIRFFERRKLERKLSRTQKAAESDPQAAEKLTQIQADLSYVKNYPINYKYVSLFSEATELTIRYRDLMRRQIQRSLSRKAQHRERVISAESQVEPAEATIDPFFSEDAAETAQFQTEVRAEDVEESTDQPRIPYKRPRERREEQKTAGKRTHIKFTD